jgi:nuclear pore complex protein Nup155
MLLALASGNTFIEFGEQPNSGSITNLAPELGNVAKQAFYDCGERPMWAERMTYGTGEHFPLIQHPVQFTRAGDGSGTALFSGRREGFVLYFARLVRPIWKSKLIKPAYVSIISS